MQIRQEPLRPAAQGPERCTRRGERRSRHGRLRARLMQLKYLAGYPPALLAQVQGLIAEGRLAESVSRRYPEGHEVNTDRALYGYVGELKSSFMRSAPHGARVSPA